LLFFITSKSLKVPLFSEQANLRFILPFYIETKKVIIMKILIGTGAYECLGIRCIPDGKCGAKYLINGSEQSLLIAAENMCSSKEYFNIVVKDSEHEILNGEDAIVLKASTGSRELIIHVNWVNQWVK
jgi:hypothetical protein